MASEYGPFVLGQGARTASDAGVRAVAFAAVARAVQPAQSPQDFAEALCRECAERGIVAAVFRREPRGEWTLIAHRFTARTAARLTLAVGAFERERITLLSAGRHPLVDRLSDDALRYPALQLPVSGGDAPYSVSLLAPGWSTDDLAAGELLAASLGATLGRIATVTELRETRGRLQRREQASDALLGEVRHLGAVLDGATDLAAALRLTVANARRLLGADAFLLAVCIDGEHYQIDECDGELLPPALDELRDRLSALTTATTARAHDDCHVIDLSRERAPAGGLAVDGELALTLTTPIAWGGAVRGVALAAFATPLAHEQAADRALAIVAGQLGATAARFTGQTAVWRGALASVAGSLHDGIALLDPDGRVVVANPAGVTALTDLRAGAVALPPVVVELAAAARRERFAGPRVAHTADGRSLTLSAVALDPGGAAADVALLTRDTTEVAIMRRRLLEAERLAALGQLVAAVAHELNSPLTAVSGFAQLLLLAELPEAARGHARIVLDEAERALHIVQDLLASARRRPPTRTPVSVNHLVERVLDLRQQELRLHGVEVRWRPDPTAPPCWCDPEQLQQVLLNIVNNAQQAIAGHQSAGVITVATAFGGDHLRITIADDGPGVEPALRERVFEPFFTTKPIGEGTGLGLTISYGIIEEHGGDLTLGASEHGGALVTITLPVTAPDQAAVSPAVLPLARPRLLLVMGDAADAALCDRLTALGYSVECVADGAAAATAVGANSYDLLLVAASALARDHGRLWRRVNGLRPHLRGRMIVVATAGAPLAPVVERHGLPVLLLPADDDTLRAMLARATTGGRRAS